MSPSNKDKVAVEPTKVEAPSVEDVGLDLNTKTKSGKSKRGGKTSAPPKQPKTQKLTAAQRIEMLERLVLQYSQRFNILADEIDRLRATVQSLSNRVTATITATDSEDAVKQIQVQKNTEELEGKVKFLTDRGVLVKNDEMTVVDKCFVVGRDVDDAGKVTNPRVQFAVNSLPQELKDTIIGKKMGDLIKPEGAPTSLEIVELYEVHEVDLNKEFPQESPDQAEAKAEEKAEEEAKATV